MEYVGKLYGNIGGQKYFDLGKTSEDWNKLESEIELLKCANDDVKRIAVERDEARTLIRKIRDKVSKPWDVGDTVAILCDLYFRDVEE